MRKMAVPAKKAFSILFIVSAFRFCASLQILLLQPAFLLCKGVLVARHDVGADCAARWAALAASVGGGGALSPLSDAWLAHDVRTFDHQTEPSLLGDTLLAHHTLEGLVLKGAGGTVPAPVRAMVEVTDSFEAVVFQATLCACLVFVPTRSAVLAFVLEIIFTRDSLRCLAAFMCVFALVSISTLQTIQYIFASRRRHFFFSRLKRLPRSVGKH